jgi:hypothetical protein
MAWLHLKPNDVCPAYRDHPMVKLKLDLEPDPELTVIGISSHVNDYRLCWALNQSTGLDLRRRRSDIVETFNGRTARYAAFDHEDPQGLGRCTLVNNHGNEGILVREQRQADFFLVVDKAVDEAHPDLLERIRATEFVLTAFPLAFGSLRSGHKLLL